MVLDRRHVDDRDAFDLRWEKDANRVGLSSSKGDSRGRLLSIEAGTLRSASSVEGQTGGHSAQ
jgi:hypothetical protein